MIELGPHARTTDAVAASLEVDPQHGLDPAEAVRRAARWGPNEVERTAAPAGWRMVVDAATEPFVLLLAAAGLGAVLLNEVRDGVLVLLGLLPIVGADVITEYRGERALEALRAASAPTARVRRAGSIAELPASELVPGDVVLVRVGDVVPADLRVSAADRLLVDRSVLTGESLPQAAGVAPDPADAELAARRSMLYSGTSVVAGRGEGIVVAT